jgi:TatD DNase family protein
MNQYVDVHCHIIHDQFTGEEDDVTHRAQLAGLEYCVVNGLEPISNRAVLDLCARHPNILLPALGIYPLDACAHVIDSTKWDHPFVPPTQFNVDAEIDWIDQMCSITNTTTNKKIVVAIGECGLDAYYTTQSVELDEQERVLRKLIHVAVKHDLPLILHTRKAELRTFEILQEMNVIKADFHCFCGKAKLGKRIAEAGYYLSIPSVIARSESFRALVKVVPLSQLLTETDSPYQGPIKDVRNEPNTVPIGVKVIAEVKGITEMEAMMAIRTNFRRLMDR